MHFMPTLGKRRAASGAGLCRGIVGDITERLRIASRMTLRTSPAFLDHPGECARLLRSGVGGAGGAGSAGSAEAAALGAARDWPAELRLLVGLMLGANEAMFVAWGPQRIFFYNDAYAPILGSRHPAALGQPIHQVWSEIWPTIGPLFDRVDAGHSVQNDDLMLPLLRDGHAVEAHFSFGYHPVRDDSGAVAGLFCVCRETTALRHEQRLRAEARVRLLQSESSRFLSEERFKAAVRAVGSMWTNNAQGEMTGEQPGWAALSGQTEAQYQGFGWASALHPDDAPPTLAAWKQAVTQQRNFECEHRVRAPDGSWRRYAVRAVPVLAVDGSVREWVGVHIDVTDARLASEALREADRRKDEFLAILSHELRNPLAPIRSAVAVLDRPGLTPEALETSRQIIHRQVRHMAWLLDDLLDISRISAGRLELRLRRLPLRDVVQAAIETAQPQLDEKRHTLHIELSPLDVEVDELRLSQVLANLLRNAAKYTDPGGQIRVKASVASDELVIAVSDNGVGITPQQLPYVFDMFSPLRDTSDRLQDGLGIGLALSRGLVELHCGRLTAASAGLGCGSTFSLVLPARLIGPHAVVQPEMQPMSKPVSASHAAHARATPRAALSILIADDNRDAADTLAMLLELEHHTVHVAHDGPGALALAAQVRPQVALLDIGMPGMNGYEVARRLRREPWGATMLIVALTGWGQQEDHILSQAAGFDHHHTKPVDPQVLIESLAAWRDDISRISGIN